LTRKDGKKRQTLHKEQKGLKRGGRKRKERVESAYEGAEEYERQSQGEKKVLDRNGKPTGKKTEGQGGNFLFRSGEGMVVSTGRVKVDEGLEGSHQLSEGPLKTGGGGRMRGENYNKQAWGVFNKRGNIGERKKEGGRGGKREKNGKRPRSEEKGTKSQKSLGSIPLKIEL